MSLNWREIEAVLRELNLDDCWLRRIRQPDYMRLILEFARPGLSRNLEIVLKSPFVRINAVSDNRRVPPALPKPPRFNAVLKSRLEGARLTSVRQMGRDRIVRFCFGPRDDLLYLDAKLWGNGANLILSDAGGIIIDAFSRRPGRNEAPGESWPPEGIDPKAEPTGDPGDYPLRDLPGDGDWNSRVEAWYLGLEEAQREEFRLAAWRTWLDERDTALTSRKKRLEEGRRRFGKQLRDGHWADLIMSNHHAICRGDSHLECDDWENPGSLIRIPLKTTLSPQENAEAFYAAQKRAERALERLDEDGRALEKSIAEVTDLRRRLEARNTGSPPFDSDPPETGRREKNDHAGTPGLWIRKGPYIIAVGRNARESDWLLRRWAKGNDTWLHVRDWPGGHVFIRVPRGKTVPLEILLDGGNLALSYSRGRRSGSADLYYTQVKNLRRAKDGPAGTVLPTREKNLRITLDEARLEALKECAAAG